MRRSRPSSTAPESCRFEEALAVADSALRSRAVCQGELPEAVDRLPRPGPASRVVRLADARADNPVESVVRAFATENPELRLVSQVNMLGCRWDCLPLGARATPCQLRNGLRGRVTLYDHVRVDDAHGR